MNKIEANIRLPNLHLNLTSNKPEQTLRELHKVLEAMKTVDILDFDEDLMWRVGYISEELRANPEALAFLKNAMEVEPVVKHKRVPIHTKHVLDFNSQTKTAHLDLGQAKKQLRALCNGMENTNSALVHVAGPLTYEENNTIADMVKQQLSSANIKTVFTHKKIDKSVLEIVFCGTFED